MWYFDITEWKHERFVHCKYVNFTKAQRANQGKKKKKKIILDLLMIDCSEYYQKLSEVITRCYFADYERVRLVSTQSFALIFVCQHSV